MPDRLTRALCGALLVLTTGCATVGPSVDRATTARELDAAHLRAAAVAAADLGAGWTVTLMDPAHGTAPTREVADVAACQPLLDAVAPANTAAGPTAETDLTAARAADPRTAVYEGLLAFPAGRAERLRGELDQLLTRCGSFTSTPAARKGAPVAPTTPATQTKHSLSGLDTPTPEGADAATAFTLTTESGGTPLAQRALVARVSTVLVVFSTVGTGGGAGNGAAPEPDPQVVRAQLAKLRTAVG